MAQSEAQASNSDTEHKYTLPRGDELESRRLDLQHHLLVLEYGLYGIPPTVASNSTRVMDIGCGNGVWVKQFAQKHTQAFVLGVDASPPEKDNSFPVNCDFRQLDLQNKWDIPDGEGAFDFIHGRLLVLGIRDWDTTFAEVYRHVKPGGYFQMLDILIRFLPADNDIDGTSKCAKYTRWVREAEKRMGADWEAPLQHGDRIRKAGFNVIEDKQNNIYADPVKWGGPEKDTPDHREAGRVVKEAIAAYMDNSADNFISVNGTPEEEGKKIVREAKEEFQSKGEEMGHCLRYVNVIAHKPSA